MADHDKWMGEAFKEAERAYREAEVPVGAVVVWEDKVIGRGHNRVENLQDPTAHAEMLAITAAANYLNSWRLEGTSLYVTLEPCPMCAGAIVLARIGCLVYGASDPRMGSCGSTLTIIGRGDFDSHIQVVSGVMAAKCAGIMEGFFKQLRRER